MSPDLLSPTLAVAVTAYTIGAASPGPSNMAIMAAAMSQGRGHALALAAGVLCGSMAWGLAAAFGLSALMRAYSWSLWVVKLMGGAYMLWLAWKAARAACCAHEPSALRLAQAQRYRQSFMHGLGLHLTNPKAIVMWLSIVALALPPGVQGKQALQVVGICAPIGLAVFFSYALAFSTPLARALYARIRRGFNAVLAAVFAYAGLRLLLSRASVT